MILDPKRPLAWTISALLGLAPSAVAALELTDAERAKLDTIEPANTIVFEPGDSANMRVAKASKTRPTKQQLDWQKLEFTCFIHFGPNTFTGVEWGNGKEDPKVFNPTDVDTDQWCRIAKAAGMKLMVITVKHHDGFCTWQTRYNDKFSVLASPWENGKGDVLRRLAESCKKHGLKLGVYLSPADLYQIENEDGLYGNLSKYQKTVIPTDPKHFSTNPTKGRPAPEGKPTFTYEVDDYNRLMLNQLYELLTEYGPIHEVWFDGAHPKRKGGQQYTEEIWFEMIRELAPDAAIFGGPDIRWCGNEAGHTRQSEWSPMPIKGDPKVRKTWGIGSWRAEDLGSRQRVADFGDFVHWFPSEVDTSIRHGWFWRDENQHVRSAEELFSIYENSIGGNAVLLLNVPPNRNGRFSPRDEKALLALGKRIESTYGTTAATLTAEGNVYTFDQPATINRCMIMEDVATHGQQVDAHALDAWIDGEWQEVATATTIGYKRILSFRDVETSKIRLRIEDHRLEPKISHVSVHYDRAPLKAPAITRDREGTVTIDGNGVIRFTTDGSTPTANSPQYTGSFPLPKGGVVTAMATREDERSEPTTARFDIAKTKWSIHAVSSENPGSNEGAAMAIDGDPKTIWHSKWSGGTDPMPHSITINLGEELDLTGFTYLPRHGGAKGGILNQYKVELSRDGENWVAAGEGRFDNIENDPTEREIRFKRTFPRVRYLRFIGVQSIEGKPHSSAAEIGVLTR
ncbi:alpha-L-fucosidase [Sulfuriroseicoccus oceanibius]|uniref:alpha-L-fucosidase n=1 Tax=Sulfuriroseicoccus oceanibius TaxID=2707525 RepID=A0A6B3LFR5_9BACT|nr:alpha-L-fucosidase [Sulfuriroseicoccus oceanibius]QQL45901.1 alpha-L-fucosidase [Sulfuriroseicoccus oceanibius]